MAGKAGANITFKGKVYNPKALSKGTSFGIMFSKQDQQGEWHNKFMDVYTPQQLVLESKEQVEFTGFLTLDTPFGDRPAQIKIVAMHVQKLGNTGQPKGTVDNTQKQAANADPY